jgi:hypothetical protein
VALRGVHDLHEGKTLKEAAQEWLRHETRPWNSVGAKTAERLREPESGSVVSADNSQQHGAQPRMSLKSAKTIGKAGSDF